MVEQVKIDEQVRSALLSLLRKGLLRIRILGEQGDAKRCANEAHHLHNVPGLLLDYRDELLAFYWDVEREGYLGSGEDGTRYKDEWLVLGEHRKKLPPSRVDR